MKHKLAIFQIGFLLCFFGCVFSTQAQKIFGNEWVTYGKPYYKFHAPSQDQVMNYGRMYRRDMNYSISYTVLQNAGFPIDTIDPRHIQIFTNGEETAIEIIGEEDGSFDTGDFIRIYSEHNDASMDEPLFDSKDDIPMNLTLHGFQKAHFISYTTDGTLGKRIEKIAIPNNASAVETAHNNQMSSNYFETNVATHPKLTNYPPSFQYGFENINYAPVLPTSLVKTLDNAQFISYGNEVRWDYWKNGTALQSHFMEGKGFVGKIYGVGEQLNHDFKLVGITNPEIRVKVRIIGLLNTPHHVRVILEDENGTEVSLGDMFFNNYEIATLESTVNTLNLTNSSPNLKVKITAIQANGSATGLAQEEEWAPLETEVFYDQDFDIRGPFWGERYYGILHHNGIFHANVGHVGYVSKSEAWYSDYNVVDKFFRLKPKTSGISKIELDDVPSDANLYDVTDINNVQIIESAGKNGTKDIFLVPNSQSERKLYISNYSHKITHVYDERIYEAVNMNADYLLLYNGLRAETTRASYRYTDAVQQYADYRASDAGGNYTVQMSDIEDLYDLFTYGNRTPLALRNFADYMLSNGIKPKALFLVGKGLEYVAADVNQWTDIPPLWANRWSLKPYFVPSMGMPASDNEITAGLAGYPKHVPAIPTGRLSVAHYAKTEVLDYLEKVKAHDAMTYDTDWAKNIVHISGGNDNSELQLFKSYTDHYTSYAEENYMNCDVLSLQKATPTGLSNAQKTTIKDRINNGTLLLTMYGHSDADGSANLDIGDPINVSDGYVNSGKYPMIIMNGCQSGRIFEDEYAPGASSSSPNHYTIGEKWVLAKDKGAVLFWSHAQLGFTSMLYTHTANFYETLADKNFISKSVGEIVQEACRKSIERGGRNPIMVANVQQFILQGDPALRLFKENKPDYFVDDSRITMLEPNGEKITNRDENFTLEIDISNLGITDLNQFKIKVERTLPNGVKVTYPLQSYDYIPSRETVQFEIEQEENVTSVASGNNTFVITIDVDNKIDEVREDNNTATFTYNFPEKDLIPIKPIQYSIQSQVFMELIVQRTNLNNTAEEDYFFEMDTSADFSSGLQKDTILTGSTMPTWTTILPDDSNEIVWYWRARNVNSDPNESYSWATSSFTFIKDSPTGWSQDHYNQFTENEPENLAFMTGKKEAFMSVTTNTFTTIENVSIERGWLFDNLTNQAVLTSPLIGQAHLWQEVLLDFENTAFIGDWQVDVIGVTGNFVERVLYTNIQNGLDIRSIPSSTYPYLRLRLTLKNITKTVIVPPLKMWRVLYDELPEGVIIPDEKDEEIEVPEGDTATVNLEFGNVSDVNYGGDNLIIKYIITNPETGKETIIYDTIPTPEAGDTVKIITDIPTDELDEGENDVIVIVNPADTVNSGNTGTNDPIYNPNWEPEQNQDNNIFEFVLVVKSDKINPILDVMIDGRYLMDGDIVSPNPIISIDLDDNSKKNKLVDAVSHLVVYLSRCETCPLELVDLSTSDSISWSITEDKNQLSLNYLPNTLPDGLYTLKVQGTDVSGNNAGTEAYQISFQVVNKTSVSHFYPYPNPMIDKTQFIFTLTGEVPDDMRIRIMTVSGKIVRTITQEELGNVHVGNNISEFMWDGTDEYGDKLANGTYLYRVDIKSKQEFGLWNTAGDKFFKKGYGKIYLLR